MAILSVSAAGMSFGQARSGSVSRDGGRAYTRILLVETSGQSVGPKAVIAGLSVAIGQHYKADRDGEDGAEDLASFAQSIAVAETSDDGCQWIATIEYGRYNAEINPLNPLDSRPKISWQWEQGQRVATRDKDGEDVVNSAGDYFVPAVEVDEARPIFQIVHNESTLFPTLIDAYQNSINDAPWFGMAARKWKVTIGPATQVFNPEVTGNYYWEVTYQFYLSREEEGWIFKVADQGMRELYGADLTKIRHVTDDHGEKVTEPAPLNADGTKKATGEALEFIHFNILPETDFSGLGFDLFLASLTGG
jgi:hypothetical protein